MEESEKSVVQKAISHLIGNIFGMGRVPESEDTDQQDKNQHEGAAEPARGNNSIGKAEDTNDTEEQATQNATVEESAAEDEAMAKAERERGQEIKHALEVAKMHTNEREAVAKKAEDAAEKIALEEREKMAKEQQEKEKKEQTLRLEREELEMEQMHEEQEEEEKAALEKELKLKASMEKAKQLRIEKERQREDEARKRCLQDKVKTEAFRPTLYCLSLMMPFGYEPSLLAEQHKQRVGIFSCDETAVFSNSTTILSTGKPAPVNVTLMPGSLAVTYGGRWGTAMNTGVFNRLWTEVVRLGTFRHYDWTVKVDPDAVFFPERLRNVIRRRAPMSSIRIQGSVPSSVHCSECKLEGHKHETCAQHVQQYQRENKTCAEALASAARAPPTDCGCVCDDFACDLANETAMYINNCKWGLHGPIEVFSRRAVASYLAGLPQCIELLKRPWGEDKFIDQCMQELGVTRVNEYDVLSETACGEQPSPCGSEDVSFHPFKSIESYFACFGFANKFGKGPEDVDCNSAPRLAAYMKK